MDNWMLAGSWGRHPMNRREDPATIHNSPHQLAVYFARGPYGKTPEGGRRFSQDMNDPLRNLPEYSRRAAAGGCTCSYCTFPGISKNTP